MTEHEVTDETAHPEEATHVDSHAPAEHDDHGGDEHGHDGPALGPIDWAKWGFAIVGGIGGLIVLGFFLYALGGLPA